MHPAVHQFNQIIEQVIHECDPWTRATEKARSIANQRLHVVTAVQKAATTMTMQAALAHVIQQCEHNLSDKTLVKAYTVLNGPKPATIRLWCKAFDDAGKNGLLPKHSGTARNDYGWEARALELYHKPQKPSIRKVARDLREKYGFKSAREHNVRYFFSTLPADLQERSPWRMGRKQYNDGLREHISRTTENLPVGVLFQGDGHTIDQYLRHPRTGKLWRAELTVFMDVRSRYIVGWYISVAESSVSTMAALSHAMGTHNHVPALIHIDNGSGFKSKLMNSETSGFYASFGIEPIWALPGNAKAKNVERFFRTMEDDFGKDFDTYCGYDMSPDASRLFSSSVKAEKAAAEGKIHIPTVDEWCESFTDWLNRYHNRPHPEEPGTTPAELWSQLERVPVVDHNLLVKPREEVSVSRSLVTLHKRKYISEYLYQYEGQKLVAEYDLHDDSTIRLFDLEGRWLTTATLKTKKDYISTSRIEDAQRKRLLEQTKRLNNKIHEKRMEAGRDIPLHVEQASDIDQLEESFANLQAAQEPQNDTVDYHNLMTEMMKAPTPEPDPDDHNDDIDPLSIYYPGETTHGR